MPDAPLDMRHVARQGYVGRTPRLTFRSVLFAWLTNWVVSVLLPRWAARQRRKLSRPTKRELSGWVVVGMLGQLLRDSAGRWAAKKALEKEKVVDELRTELGREPTDEEIGRRIAETHGYAQESALKPTQGPSDRRVDVRSAGCPPPRNRDRRL